MSVTNVGSCSSRSPELMRFAVSLLLPLIYTSLPHPLSLSPSLHPSRFIRL
jgi:hypothetical protein